MTLEHKTSLKSLGYICSNSQRYIVWVKMNIFCKFPILNIFKLNFLLVICNDNNLICTVLKAIFSRLRFFQIPDNQIVVSPPNMSYPNKPYNNGKIIHSAFRCIHFKILGKIDPYDWFCGSGSLTHIYIYIYIYIYTIKKSIIPWFIYLVVLCHISMHLF